MVNYVCFNKGNGKRIDYHFWNSISENKYEMELVTTNEVGIKAGDKYVICESKSYFYTRSNK